MISTSPTTQEGFRGDAELLRDLGYDPHPAFNTMNAKERLLFFDDAHGRQVDVFVSSFRMCHEIPLKRRLETSGGHGPARGLLLTKLQIIELNEKDVRDAVALFLEHDVTDDDSGIRRPGRRALRRRLGPLAHDHAEPRVGPAHLEHYDVDRDLVSARVSRLQERIEARRNRAAGGCGRSRRAKALV